MKYITKQEYYNTDNSTLTKTIEEANAGKEAFLALSTKR